MANDPGRLARFSREAQVLASLNHPNIAHIHGLEQSDGVRALVMELVEGPTLADRIAHGPIPLDEALPIAKQIAEALEAAHEQGTIHRDLKPANIKVRSDGTVKVLDFGLAKALDPAGGLSTSGTMATASLHATEAGMILGTPAYMSPEQARGKPVDKRVDIWAFGCVLVEMLSGRALFARETASDSLAAILERDPDWSALPGNTPLAVRRLLERCLKKDPQRRLRDIGEARLEIEEVMARPVGTVDDVRTRRADLPWTVAVIAIVAALAMAVITWQQRSSSAESAVSWPVSFTVTAPPGYQIDVTSPVGVSPDGRAVAFAASRGGTQQIFVRDLDKREVAALPGTEGGFAPFFSPDGQWVGFFAAQKMKKVLRSGGAPLSIADFSELAANRNASAAWDEQDTILFTPDVFTGIRRVSSSGGTPTDVTKAAPGEAFHAWPQLLPGGRSILFSAIGEGPIPQAYVQRLDTGERKPLVRGHGTRYVRSGHLVFVQGGSLMAVPFDVARLELTGSPTSVVPNVTPPFRLRTMTAGFNRLFDVSPAGTLAFLSAGRPPQHALVWVDRSGREQPTNASGGTYAQPRLSPDGRRIAVVVRADDVDDIWLYEIERHTWNRFTFEGNSNFPLWTADGTRLAYNTDRGGGIDIEWKRADSSGAPETIVPRDFAPRSFPFSWSPDGTLAFVALRPAQDIFVVSRGQKPTAFAAGPFVEGAPMFAPDGHSIAYVSRETGRNEIYLRPYPGSGEKLTISNAGGNEPLWSPTGRELFYRAGDAMMAVDVATRPTLHVGVPRRLFETHYEPAVALYANYTTADGERFVMIKRVDQGDTPNQINVVVNWLDELRRAVRR
jgi:serine/threonine-protein kinase